MYNQWFRRYSQKTKYIYQFQHCISKILRFWGMLFETLFHIFERASTSCSPAHPGLYTAIKWAKGKSAALEPSQSVGTMRVIKFD